MTNPRVLPLMMFAVLMAAAFGHPAAATQTGQVRSACAADVRALCSGVTPGGGRILQCMREKKDQLTEGCKGALTAASRRQR
jgi:hypothetical protein